MRFFPFSVRSLAFRRSVSLRWVLIVPFMLQTLAAVALMSYLSHRSGQRIISHLAFQMMGQAVQRVDEHLGQSLQERAILVASFREAVTSGDLDPDDLSQVQRYIWQNIRLFPQVVDLTFVDVQGRGTGYVRLLSQDLTAMVARISGKSLTVGDLVFTDSLLKPEPRRRFSLIDRRGQPVRLLLQTDVDPRETVWYDFGAQQTQVRWTPPFRYRVIPAMGVSATVRVVDPQGRFRGVVASSWDLMSLSSFLSQLDLSSRGRSFVLDRQGRLLATSLPSTLHRDAHPMEVMWARENGDRPTREIAQALERQPLGDLEDGQGEHLQLTIAGEKWFVAVTPEVTGSDLDWVLVTAIPQADFVQELRANTRNTLWICTVTLGVALGVGWWTYRRLGDPIRKLSDWSHHLAQGQWSASPVPQSGIAEIRNLSQTLQVMANQLQQSFETIQGNLQVSREKYQTLFNILPVGISITNAQGHLIEGNPQAEVILGLTISQQVQHDYDDNSWRIIRPDGSPMPPEEFASVRALKENCFVGGVEMGVQRPQGDLCWINVSAAPIPLPDYGVAIVYVDITQQKNEVLARKESEKRLHQIAQASPGAIYIVVQSADGHLSFDYVSAAFEEIHELPQAVIMKDASLYLQQMHVEDRSLYQEKLKISRHNLTSFSHEWRIITASGKTKWIQANSRPEQRSYGDVYWYGVMLDITEHKLAELALMEAKKAAELASQAKGAFLANMSHEIRTPMNGVLGMVDLLAQTELSPIQRDYVKTIHDSSDLLLTIINDVLDFSKLESGHFVLEQNPLDLSKLVRSVGQLLRQQAEKKGNHLLCETTPETPVGIRGDSVRLRQIFLNLLGNALKFTQGGMVHLRVDGRPGDRPNYGFVRVKVQDTGMGIAAEHLPLLFQPFSQADSSISRRFGGTGLGLAICKRLVQLMGGRLWVESGGGVAGDPPPQWSGSDLQTGTIFYVEWEAPLVDRQCLPQEEEHRGGDRPEHIPLKILLVEDNAVNQKVARLTFQKLGYDLEIASNGREAIAMVQANSYDVVFMDVQMPEMDGLSATRAIRQLPQIQPWIIAMTANVMTEDREACLVAGMDDYVSKPIRLEKIAQVLAQTANHLRGMSPIEVV